MNEYRVGSLIQLNPDKVYKRTLLQTLKGKIGLIQEIRQKEAVARILWSDTALGSFWTDLSDLQVISY